MQSQFMKLVHEYIDAQIHNLDGLTLKQRYQLTAAYLKEASSAEKWEYITEPPECEPLPPLLIDVIETHLHEPDNGQHAKLKLANTMANAAVRWCYRSIEDAFSQAHADRMYWDNHDEY